MTEYDLGQVVGSAGADGSDGSTIWYTSTAPTYANSKYTFSISNLSGKTGFSIAVNDLIFYSTYYYIVSAVNSATVDCGTRVSIKGSDASVTVVDNLNSDSSTSVLSAKQGKVLNTNKVETSAIATSFGSTTSDSKVPSEKLVKTELDKKIATSNTAGLIKNDGTIDTNSYITSSSLPTKTSDLTNDGSSSSDSLVYVETSATSGLLKNDGTVDTNTYSQSTHTHGNVNNDGTITTTDNGTFNYFAGIGSSGSQVYKASKLGSSQVIDATAHSSIGSSANATQTTINSSIDSKFANSSAIAYGQVDSTSTSTVFTATVTGITALIDGTTVMLENGVVTSADGFTLNVNNLGAKPVYSSMHSTTAETTIFNVNYTLMFVYDSTRVDGGCWICYRGYYKDTNDNTIGYQIRTNSSVFTASDKGYRYRIWLQTVDGQLMPVNTSTSTNATANRSSAMNTREFLLDGKIVYNSTKADYQANATLPATTMWQQYNLTIGYSFNNTGSALTLTSGQPFYMVCTDEGEGLGKLASPYYTQTLPNSADGKLYIFLGMATGATTVELSLEHPIFEYKNGAIGLWSSNNHTHGNITSDGKITTTDSGKFTYFVGVGASGSSLYKSSSLNSSSVTDSTAHTNLGTSANASQSDINTAIDSLIGSAITYINQ